MVAWIQVHQQLKDHRKLLAAADELEIEPAHMLGVLISFWLWALDNAPSGSLAGISNRMIARAAQWSDSPDLLVDAMANAGLLDKGPDGSLTIHDWYEYTGKLIDQREAEKMRSRRRRAAAAETANDQQTTAGQSTKDHKKTESRVNQSIPDHIRLKQSTPTEVTLPPNPPPKKEPDVQERRFAEFWQLYPKKVGKKAALISWKRIKPNADMFELILQAVANAKVSDQWRRESGRFIPNPATWLNQGRWDDELPISNMVDTQNTGKPNTMGVLASIIADEEGDESF